MSGWIQAFIVIAAVAIVIQMAILLGIFFQVRTAIEQFARIATDLQTRIDPILLRTNRILEDSEDRVASIMGDAAEITRVARGSAQKIDRVFTDAVERLRVQIIRADHILTGTLEVVEESGMKFKRTLWTPIQQASAILKGMKVAIDMLRGQNRRPEPDAATADEELFI
ncbi:MAG TPA: hypothetical protein VKB40_13265 [Candidatus Acidoferrales bacterium]|jgi:hypothetical protein|nr:hypothetical protein [Candidatus Acidoferrales bacterium]